MRKFLFKTTLEVRLVHGRDMPSEIDVQIEYGVIPGSEPTMVDPGSDASVEILRVWIVPEGQPRMLAPWLDSLAADDADLLQELLCDAAEREEAAADEAADARREERLQLARAH